MRISTFSTYETAITNFNNMQSSLANTENEISSGIALTSPSVNPTASAQVLVTTQESDINTQYGVNQQNTSDALNTADTSLSGVTNILQSLESLIVEANGPAESSANKTAIALQMQSGVSQLMNLANSTDANGNYIFSGSTVGTPPFASTSNGAVYNGNQETQSIQVDTSQQLPVTFVGSSVFGNIQVSPNAYFGTPSAGNTSTATISNATVTNAAPVTNDNYAIDFTSPTAYNVVDTSTGITLSTGNAYTSGNPITVGGVQFSITNGAGPGGIPAAGDKFTLQPGNQNIFQVLTNAITALKTPVTSQGAQSDLETALTQANKGINSSLNNVLDARDQIGNSLQQVSSLTNVGNKLNINYQTTISDLQNVNLAQAATQLSEEQVTYQAAQKAFISTSGLSLISMLR